MPSLIDDADFLAEIDKLETGPTAFEGDAHSVYWEQASRVDEAGEGRIAARLPEAPASEPLVQRARSAKPVRPVQIEKRVRTGTPPSQRVGRVGDADPGRIDTPSRPEGPARQERPVHRERPVPPVHVDEIGQSALSHPTVLTTGSASQPRLVSATLAALTIVLCFTAGAGSAALVFHDRVSLIVTHWASASR